MPGPIDYEALAARLPYDEPDYEALAAKLEPSLGDAVKAGAFQGATGTFGDEITGGVKATMHTLKQMPFKDLVKGLVTGDIDPGEIGSDFIDRYRQYRDEERAKNKAASDAHPFAYGASNVAGGVATIPVAGAMGLPGGLLGAMGLGAGIGLGSSEADLTKGDVLGATGDAAIGAGVGALSHGLGEGLGWLGKKAAEKGQALYRGLGESAEKEAESLVNSARSNAGQAAQNAYRQLEHLRELGAKHPELYRELIDSGLLDKGLIDSLEQELLGKAAGKLPGAAAGKDVAAQAFADIAPKQNDIAAAALARKASTGEAARILGTPAARYAKRAAGGLVGAGVGSLIGGDDNRGLGGGVGLGLGLGFGPLVPTMLRAANRPEVRFQMWRALEKLGGAASATARGAAPGAEAEELGALRDWMYSLGRRPEIADNGGRK